MGGRRVFPRIAYRRSPCIDIFLWENDGGKTVTSTVLTAVPPALISKKVPIEANIFVGKSWAQQYKVAPTIPETHIRQLVRWCTRL